MISTSVILCTFNRGNKLEASLQSLERQTAAAAFEVVIVDNNSTDNTRAVAMAAVNRQPARFRYVFEPVQGKSSALNRGIREAQAPILMILDDDCVADPDWVQAMLNEFAMDADLSVAGGRVELHNAEDRPVTIRTYDERIPFSSPDQLFSLIPGCNLAIRRDVFDRIADFDIQMGPGSKRGLVAEDTDFIYRAFKAGFKMAYTPVPRVFHDHGHRSDSQVRSLHRAYIEGRGALYCKHILRRDAVILRMAYWEILGCFREIGRQPATPGVVIPHIRNVWWLLKGAASRILDECSLYVARIRRPGMDDSI